MKNFQSKFPPIGMRILKSFFGVSLGFLIYFLRGQQGTPFYTAIAVLWCIRAYTSESRGMAAQRVLGTFIGGAYGLILVILTQNITLFDSDFFLFSVISFSLIPVLYTTVLINKKNASYFACVVFLSIVVNNLTTQPYLFVFNRVLDTLIGIAIGMLLNELHLPRTKKENTLFVSALDDVLLFKNEKELSPYTKVELNRLLDEGLNFTICTMRTPGFVVELLEDVRINHPLVVMDGAALFDPVKNSYIKTIPINSETSQKINQSIQTFGLNTFTNVIYQDSLFIYYSSFTNNVQKAIYNDLRESPYRNYLHKTMPEDSQVVYFKLIETSEKLDTFEDFAKEQEWYSECRITRNEVVGHPDYQYLKIFDQSATKEAMLDELISIEQPKDFFTIGTVKGHYDYIVNTNNSEDTVRFLKNIYEPVKWNKRFKKLDDIKN